MYTKSLLQIHQFILESRFQFQFFLGGKVGRAHYADHISTAVHIVARFRMLHASHGRRPDMQLQEVQKEAEHSGLGHLLLTYPLP